MAAAARGDFDGTEATQAIKARQATSAALVDLTTPAPGIKTERYGMTVCGFVYLSNHCHLLLQPTNAHQLSEFMGHVNSKIAREAGRLHSWREKI